MALVFSPFSFGLDRRPSASPRPSLFASELPFRSMQQAMMPIFHSPFDDLEESVFGHRSVFDVLEPFTRRHQQVRQSIKRTAPHEDGLLRISNPPLHTVTKRVCYQRDPDGKVVSETTTSVKNGNEPARRTVKRRIGDKVDVKTYIEAARRQQNQQQLTDGRKQQEDFDAEWQKVTEGRPMFSGHARQLTAAHPSTSKDAKQDVDKTDPSTSKDAKQDVDKAAPSTSKDAKQDVDKADASPKAKAPKHTYFDVEDWEEDVEGQASGHKEKGSAEGAMEEAEQAGKDKEAGGKVASPQGEGSLSMMERLQQRSRENSPILSDAGDE